ncbi:hypothetical protein M9H77_04166 [Catharanthus roseus]|uniref:Uncharacterized protein n=1 Tax=Catharanthus roseus TaxID=4058 RepID=A0ACC0CDQ9_CATRO|nr:hypothetical protein M9H77_04166 [Catharanthus roseus]
MQDSPTTSQPSASQSTQSVPDIRPLAWRPPPEDSQKLLYLHVNHPFPEPLPISQLSSRTNSMCLTILGLRSRIRSEVCSGKSFRGRRGLIRATGARYGIIRIPLRIKPSPNEIRGTGLRDREDGEPRSTQDLTEKFFRSKYLEELHKHQKGEKKGEYVDFRSVQFWEKFHEVRRKAEEDGEASGTTMPDDL